MFYCGVALLAEGVDRNKPPSISSRASSVALLAEGVDRNRSGPAPHTLAAVALLAEGVDRNIRSPDFAATVTSRPPRGGRG